MPLRSSRSIISVAHSLQLCVNLRHPPSSSPLDCHKLNAQRCAFNFREHFRQSRLQVCPIIEELYDTNDTLLFEQNIEEEIEQLQAKGLFELKTEYLRDDFFTDLEDDIEILKTLRKEWENVKNDPKSDEFIGILKQKLKNEPTRKIVIFSQFIDTVDDLEKNL